MVSIIPSHGVFLKLCQKTHLAFLPLHQLAEWKFSEHLNTPSTFLFCALGFSPLLSLFHPSLHEESVLTLWNWDCKIRMEMCQMETSVYHFAISTCTALSWLLSKTWVMLLSASLLLFLFLSSAGSSSAFWKLEGSEGQLSFLILIFVLNTAAQGLRSVGLEKDGTGMRSQGRALALCQQWAVICAEEDSHCWLWEQMNSGESKAKWGTTWGSPHHPTPCITLRWGLKCSATPREPTSKVK